MAAPCCVEGCIVTPGDTYYFDFPTSGILRRKWLEVIPIQGRLPLGTVVCSKHFNKDEYEIIRGKVRLKSKVVPSLFLDIMQKRNNNPKVYSGNRRPRRGSKLKNPSNDNPLPQTDDPVNPPDGNQKKLLPNEDIPPTKDKPLPLTDDTSKELPSIKNREEELSRVDSSSQKDDLSTQKSNSPPQIVDSSPKNDLTHRKSDPLPKKDDVISRKVNPPRHKRGRPKKRLLMSREDDLLSGTGFPMTKNDDTTTQKFDPPPQKFDLAYQQFALPSQKDDATYPQCLKPYLPPKKPDPSTQNDDPPSQTDSETQNATPFVEDSGSTQSSSTGDDKTVISDKSGDGNLKSDDQESVIVRNDNGKASNVGSDDTDPKQDIEDMIVNYQIKNKVPNPALLPEAMEQDNMTPLPEAMVGVQQDSEMDKAIDLENHVEQPPVFIEISVDTDKGNNEGGSQDCLMVLESVQVEVDPSTLILDQDFEPEEDKAPDKKEDPISLLTSSDEDDVIIQEPKIDTVEVSDETDEDDMPLVKLVKKPDKKKQKKKLKKRKHTFKRSQKQQLDKFVWGMYDLYCRQCHFSTNDSVEYMNHINEHSTVIQVCQLCGYTSASKTMFARHTRKHREEKKFKCHLCEYRAKHNMSLIYHLQSHNGAKAKETGYKCQKCGFHSDVKGAMLRHIRVCDVQRYSCDKCGYATKRRTDLRRHEARLHREMQMECVPVD